MNEKDIVITTEQVQARIESLEQSVITLTNEMDLIKDRIDELNHSKIPYLNNELDAIQRLQVDINTQLDALKYQVNG